MDQAFHSRAARYLLARATAFRSAERVSAGLFADLTSRASVRPITREGGTRPVYRAAHASLRQDCELAMHPPAEAGFRIN